MRSAVISDRKNFTLRSIGSRKRILKSFQSNIPRKGMRNAFHLEREKLKKK
jgi:hypothetical protein